MFSQILLMSILVWTIQSTSIPIGPLKQQLLDVHNEYRRMQKASDMNALVWDDALSQQAANWIKRCRFEHEMKGKGENLAFDSNPNTDDALINSSMKAWYDEIKMYNYNGKSCAPSSCHYTQVVWAKTRKVGCAIEKCPYLSAFGRSIKDAWYIGCWYDPKGNWVSEYPFTRGQACSKCLNKQTCEKELCVGEGENPKEVCKDDSPKCEGWSKRGQCQANKGYMLKSCKKSCGVCKE